MQVRIHHQFEYFYRPQRSWGKVMFLHVSVILFTRGGICLSARWDTPLARQTPSSGKETPPARQTPPLHSAFWEIR